MTSNPWSMRACLPGRRLFDAHLGHAGFDGLGHAAQLFHLVDDLAGLFDDAVGEGLDVVGPAQGIDHVADLGFFLDDQLGVAGDAGGKVGGQADGLVEGVGVQGLGAAQNRGQGFQGGADDVVVGVLLGQAPARGLHMGAQHGRFGIFGVELA
jgi:hypothetical protein